MKFNQLQSKGQVLVLVALLMVVLLGVTALAIDIGRAYGVKAKLNAAVDAASFEAARALAQGNDVTQMKKKAEEVAVSYFKANYPGEFLGATPPVPDVDAVRDSGTGKWQVNVSATAQMPTMFAGLLGWKTFGVSAASEAVRATLDMVLVLDCSSSMQDVFPVVKSRAKDFVGLFDEVDDRLGLVAFSTGAQPVVSICGQYPDPEQNPQEGELNCGRGYKPDDLIQAIDGLYMGSMTASEEGMKKGLDQLNAVRSNQRSGRRAIVFFSDGAPNTFNGKFPLRGGGTAEGNLFSGVFTTQIATRVFDPRYYAQAEEDGKLCNIASLPSTDASAQVSTASYSNKRHLTGDTSDRYIKCDANAVARNMTENVANMARKEGVVIYSIGFGEDINTRQMFDPVCSTYNENGATILKRLANTPDSDTYDKNQPSGIYCEAPNTTALKVCFEKVASAVLRISK